MTNNLVVSKRSNLVMPTHYVELTKDEMPYVDGGGISTNALACMIDLGLALVTGVINGALRCAGWFGKGAIKKLLLRKAPQWARTLWNVGRGITTVNSIGSFLQLACGALSDVGSWVDKISNFCSIGGIIASVLDICDGSWDGYISY